MLDVKELTPGVNSLVGLPNKRSQRKEERADSKNPRHRTDEKKVTSSETAKPLCGNLSGRRKTKIMTGAEQCLG